MNTENVRVWGARRGAAARLGPFLGAGGGGCAPRPRAKYRCPSPVQACIPTPSKHNCLVIASWQKPGPARAQMPWDSEAGPAGRRPATPAAGVKLPVGVIASCSTAISNVLQSSLMPCGGREGLLHDTCTQGLTGSLVAAGGVQGQVFAGTPKRCVWAQRADSAQLRTLARS